MAEGVSGKKAPPDGGWGWMVVVGSFVCYFIADGWAYSFGVLFTELLEYFDEGKGKTATIGALVYAVPLLISPLPCALCNLYGCRPVAIAGGCICTVSFIASFFANSVEMLMVTLGIAVSIGLSMTYVPAIIVVMFYFEKRRGLATGLAVTGSGIGAFVYPVFLEFLLSTYSWRGTMFLLGGLSLHIIAAGALFFPIKENSRKETEIPLNPSSNETEKMENDDSESNNCQKIGHEMVLIKNSICDVEIYKNVVFILFCISALICYFWVGTPYVYLVDKAILLGFTSTKSAFLLSAIGIARTVGQIALGALADHKSVNKIILYGVSIFTCGLATTLLPLCVTYPLLIMYSLVFGFFISVTYSLQTLCIVDICGLDKASNAFGIYQLVQGLATLLGTPIPGKLVLYNKCFL